MTVAPVPYRDYRQTNVSFTPAIPAHWEVKPLKLWLDINRGSLPENTAPDYRFRYVDISGVGTGNLLSAPLSMTFGSAPSRARRIVRRGDTLLSTVRTYLKAIYTVEGDAERLIASTGFAVLTPNETTDATYVGYVLQAPAFIDQVVSRSVGVAYPAISETVLGRLPVVITANRAEQQAIAKYLKDRDVHFNRLIRNKRRLIALLHEEKQAIIQQAVTRGLDPDVAMKPAGVEWLGEIPAHWAVTRNGALFALRKQPGNPTLPILEVSLHTGVTVRNIDDPKRKQMMSDLAQYQTACAGDLAYNMMRMWQGAVGIVPVDGLVSPAYVVVSPRTGTNATYFAYLYRTRPYMRGIDGYSRGIVKDRNRLYWADYKQMPVVAPPYKEQAMIVNWLSEQLQAIDAVVERTNREIDLIREYRTRLIADVVTGQLDVREAAAALPDIEDEAVEPTPGAVDAFDEGDEFSDEEIDPTEDADAAD